MMEAHFGFRLILENKIDTIDLYNRQTFSELRALVITQDENSEYNRGTIKLECKIY